MIGDPGKTHAKADGDNQHEGAGGNKEAVDDFEEFRSSQAGSIQDHSRQEGCENGCDKGVPHYRQDFFEARFVISTGLARIKPGDGKTDGVVDYFFKHFVECDQGKAAFAKKHIADQGTNGPDIGEGATAEQNTALPGWRLDQPGEQQTEQTTGDQSGRTDERQQGNAQVGKTHDPDRGHKGYGQKKEQTSLLQQLAQVGNRQRQRDAAPLGQQAEGAADEEPGNDKGK